MQSALKTGANLKLKALRSIAGLLPERAATGVGLSWLSPIGPLKLSMGRTLRKQPGDRTQGLQFQIGTGF